MCLYSNIYKQNSIYFTFGRPAGLIFQQFCSTPNIFPTLCFKIKKIIMTPPTISFGNIMILFKSLYNSAVYLEAQEIVKSQNSRQHRLRIILYSIYPLNKFCPKSYYGLPKKNRVGSTLYVRLQQDCRNKLLFLSP